MTKYNHRRPHTALKYFCPADYYRGDPEADWPSGNASWCRPSNLGKRIWQAYAALHITFDRTLTTT